LLYRELRAQILKLLGGRCVRCGRSDESWLVIHHVKGEGAVERGPSRGTHTSYLKAILQKVKADPKEFQVLCQACHSSITGKLGMLKGQKHMGFRWSQRFEDRLNRKLGFDLSHRGRTPRNYEWRSVLLDKFRSGTIDEEALRSNLRNLRWPPELVDALLAYEVAKKSYARLDPRIKEASQTYNLLNRMFLKESAKRFLASRARR